MDINSKEIANISSVTKDNGNLVVGLKGAEKFVHIAFNKKDKYFMNPSDFIRFIKSCEGTIRHSTEYSRYIAYLKCDVGLQSCALFRDINSSVSPIEMHHGPIFNLYDIIEIQIAHLYKSGDRINTMNVAHNVLKDHFENIIQIVPLCEMAHKGWHSFQKLKNKDNSNFFLSTDSAWGDFKKFVEKYHNDFTMQHVMKIKQYLNDYEKYSNNADRPDLFNVTVTEWATKFDLK